MATFSVQTLKGAIHVSTIASLPAGALPAGVTPVSKTLFINLLDTDFNLSATIPEKIEGLSWGPDLPDGRPLLRNQRQRSEPIARNPKLRLRNRARSAEFSAAASSRPTLPTQSPDASSLGALCIPLISYLACLDFYFDLLSSTFSAVGLPNVFELALKIAESSNRRHLF